MINKFLTDLPFNLLVPTNIKNESLDFFFGLKVENSVYDSIKSKDCTIGMNSIIFQIKRKDLITVVVYYFIINKKHYFSCPFILNSEEDRELLKQLNAAEKFSIFLANKKEFFCLGPFNKTVFAFPEEWNSLEEVENATDILSDFYNSLTEEELFKVFSAIANGKLKEPLSLE